ncbi:poly-gamma-glutamate hydrolase family protein [Streptomyces noursei]|uniref:poly-gamma-glutamate hydrolase family protein n=1 Tax=Streptomyces noursei TaxID=1971 RepID=UPI00344D1BB1
MAQVICPSYSGGAVLRATKLDGCCTPIFENPDTPGNSAQVVTDAFVSIAVTPGGDTGAGPGANEENVTKADGSVCFTTFSCPTPQSYSVSMQLCALDPELVLIMQPDWCAIRDSIGIVIGFTAVTPSGCASNGFALEVWMGVYAGAGSACAQSRGGSSHGYLLFPCLTNTQIGQWAIENGPISFGFTSTSRRSSGWGRGPYNVLMNGTQPAPLPCPVRSNADFVTFVTTLPPPEAQCGVQTVDGGIPEPATVLIRRGSNVTGCIVELQVDNHGYGPVIVAWGDGAQSELREGQIGTHSYGASCGDPGAEPVTTQISVCDKEFPQICTLREITVPLPPDEPVIECLQDPTDASGKTALVHITAPPQSWCGQPDADTLACACPGESPIGDYGVRIDWGEDSERDSLQYVATGTDCQVTVRRTYGADGRYNIKVCRNDQPNFCARCTYVAGGLRPDVTFISWDENCTATIFVANFNRGTVSIDWGDGTRPQTGITEGRITHSYTAGLGRSFLIMVCSEAVEGGCRSLRSPVCTGAGGTDLIDIQATCDRTDAGGHTVLVTADNRGHGTVVIAAVGGTVDNPTNQGDGQDVTKVTFAGASEFTITAADPDEPERTGFVVVTIPCTPAATATAKCDPANDHHVTVTPAPGTQYPVTVDWSDGTTTTYAAGQTIEHTYWRDTDTLQPERPAAAMLGGPVTLAQSTVHQQANINNTNGDVYFTQVIQDGRQLAGETAPVSYADRARRGDLSISRVSPTGQIMGTMFALGFDHGAALGLVADGTNVNLWTGYRAVASSDNGYATAIARFTFANNTVLRVGDAAVTEFNAPGTADHVTPSVDVKHDQIALRYQSAPATTKITVWKLSEFQAKNYANKIYDTVVEELDQATNVFQCWTVYGRYAYYQYGADDPAQKIFTIVDLTTGKIIKRVNNDQHKDITYREAESIFIVEAPEGPRLAWGFASGTTGARRANLYQTAPHRAAQPITITLKDAAGTTTTATGVPQIPCTTAPGGNLPVSIKLADCDAGAPNRLRVTYVNPNRRGVKIYWIANDPNPTTHQADTGTVMAPRDYAPGTYQVCAVDLQDATLRGCGTYPVPCVNKGTDTYFNFGDLANDRVLSTGALVNPEGKDKDWHIEVRTPPGVTTGYLTNIAIHGGEIEPPPQQLADATAQALNSGFYTFSGHKTANTPSLHIASTRFDEPTGVQHVAAAGRVISWHGHADDPGEGAMTYLGGLDAELRDAIAAALKGNDTRFPVSTTPPEKWAGVDPANICNRSANVAGVQIEISLTQRRKFFNGGDLSWAAIQNPANRTADFTEYVKRVAAGINAVLNPPGA